MHDSYKASVRECELQYVRQEHLRNGAIPDGLVDQSSLYAVCNKLPTNGFANMDCFSAKSDKKSPHLQGFI